MIWNYYMLLYISVHYQYNLWYAAYARVFNFTKSIICDGTSCQEVKMGLALNIWGFEKWA